MGGQTAQGEADTRDGPPETGALANRLRSPKCHWSSSRRRRRRRWGGRAAGVAGRLRSHVSGGGFWVKADTHTNKRKCCWGFLGRSHKL